MLIARLDLHQVKEVGTVSQEITSIQGTHMFRRDRMCQVIRCNPWSTRLHPHPTIIKKMRTYLELEWKIAPKFQPQQNQSRAAQPNTNPLVRKETKATDMRRKLIPTKRYKVQVVAKPKYTPKTSNATTQLPKTVPNFTINSKKGNPSQGSTPSSNPTTEKCSYSCWHPMTLSWDKIR